MAEFGNMTRIRALTRLLASMPGEAFNSYVERLAASHKVSLLVMLKYVGMIEDERYVEMAGYGILLDKSRLERFSTATRLDAFVVAKMLLYSYDGIAVNLPSGAAVVRNSLCGWATSEWAYLYSTHACPHCIREDQGAWQLTWKLPWSFACVKHKCYLVPRCPACEQRFGRGHNDQSLSPWLVRQVPRPGHCSNPLPDRKGRVRRNSLYCGHDLGSIPTEGASLATLRVQEMINECLTGRAPPILDMRISAADYFYDLRSLCAFIFYCAESDDLGRLADPEAVAFGRFAAERESIFDVRNGFVTLRNREHMRAHQESPELMASIIRLATTILAAKDARSITALILPLTERFIARVGQRWASSECFHFSDRIAPVIDEDIALRSVLDRVVGHKAVTEAETPLFAFDPRHVPQLLWKGDYDRSFDAFFPTVTERSARLFCAVSLVKLCGDITWCQSAAQLGVPVGAAIRIANWCIGTLEETGGIESFGKALRRIAMRLSHDPEKIDYGARREALSALTNIPPVPWSNICRAADVAPGSSRRNKWAAVWLWAELTEGDWRMAPALARANIGAVRDVSHALGGALPKLIPHLHDYGKVLLADIERISESSEPLLF